MLKMKGKQTDREEWATMLHKNQDLFVENATI